MQTQIGQLMRAQPGQFVECTAILLMAGNPFAKGVNPGCEWGKACAMGTGEFGDIGHGAGPSDLNDTASGGVACYQDR